MQIKRSYFLAIAIALGLAGWIASGELVNGNQPIDQTPIAANGEAPHQIIEVRVRKFKAEDRRAVIRLTGRTEAEAKVEMKAQTTGAVMALPASEGTMVKKDDLVCEIDKGSREARLAQAHAALEQASADFEGATSLKKSGFVADTRVRALKALVDAASAAVADAELDLARTRIVAPFDGVVESHKADIGAYLDVGAPCVMLTARDPMLIVGQVSEREVALLAEGMTGRADLVTGQSVEGRIRFISPSADDATRTFRIELEIPNGDGALRDGVTARIAVPLPPTRAHKIATNYLALNDAGDIGVKTVGADNIVSFSPVQIVGDDPDGIWITGLPEETTVITVGQDYVLAGEAVKPVEDKRGQL